MVGHGYTINVLLIEDDPEETLLLKKMLQKGRGWDFACHVEEVDKLQKGLERLVKEDIDVVLLDITLPDAQGLDSLVRLHAHAPSVPVIILTGLDYEALGLEAVRQGAQDYLVKGEIDSSILTRAIRYAIERRRLEKIKDEFISTVSHELRTPLSVVKAAVANLRDGIVGEMSPDQKKVIAMTSRNIDRLGRIINDLLDLSRLESGKARINLHSVQEVSLIHDTIHGFHQEASQHKIRLLEEVPKNLPDVYADPDMVIQVLNNLFHNAIRFAKTKVLITAKEIDSGIQVSVVDDGPGIPKDKLGDLFKKFVQLDRPMGGAGYKGTGLGLAISKEIIDLHHGKIWVESSKGQGTAFHFTLPRYDENSME